MSEPQGLQLADVIAFNESLLSLSNAGLPMNIELDSVPLKEALDRICYFLATQNGFGRTIEQGLSDESIPWAYRHALIAWFYTERKVESLTPIRMLSHWRQEVDSQVRSTAMQPIVLFVLCFIGFVFVANFLSPRLDSLYNQARLPIGMGSKILDKLRTTFPYWGTVIPVIAAILWFFRGRNRSVSRRILVSARIRETKELEKSSYANSMSLMLSHGMDAEQAIAKLGPLEANTTHSGSGVEPTTGSSDLSGISKTPPLVQWAVQTRETDIDHEHALRFVSRLFCRSSRIRTQRWGAWFPALAGSLVGGLLVLAFALSLFGPLAELLHSLARK